MSDFRHVTAAVFNEPWLIDPAKMVLITAALEHVMAGGQPWAARGADPSMKRMMAKPEIVGSTAVIPIMGVISRRANMFTEMSGGTSIELLDSQLSEALASDAVKSILFHIDSPGGAAQGVPEFASRVYDAAKTSTKPIVGFCELAASAAYWIGSQCDALYCSEAAPIGSIGVIMTIMDDTRAMKNQGVDPVVIRSSELKAPGAGGPLTPNQMQSLQDRVQQIFGMFKDGVSRARAVIDIEAVSTGDVWLGKRAVEMGLVDSVSNFDAVLAKLAQ